MIREKTGSTHAETLNIFWQQPETSDINSSSQKCHKNKNMLITIRNQKVLPTTRIEIRTFWYQHPRDQKLSQLGKKVNKFWQCDNYRTNIRKWHDQNEHQAECIGIFWQHSENPDNNFKKNTFPTTTPPTVRTSWQQDNNRQQHEIFRTLQHYLHNSQDNLRIGPKKQTNLTIISNLWQHWHWQH